PADVSAANAAVSQARSNVAAAQAKLDTLVNGPLAGDLAASQGAVDSARASLSSNQAKLTQLTIPNADDVSSAQQALDAARASLGSAQARYEQVRSGATVTDSQSAVSGVDAAEANARAAQAKLQQVLAPPLDSDLLAAQQAVQQAQANLALKLTPSTPSDLEAQRQAVIQSQANLALKRAPYVQSDILTQQAAVQQAQVALQSAQSDLDSSTLTAPFAGIVSAVNMNVGENAAGAAATSTGSTTSSGITIVNPSQLRADVQVDESDVAQIALGQRATLTFDALANRRFPGTVSAISPAGTTSQGVVGYQVSLALRNADAVRAGMTATAEIITAQREDVLVVPNRAITRQGQDRTVLVNTANGPLVRKVQVGMSNDQNTEITDGIEEGEEVVLPTTAARASVPGARPGQPGGLIPGGGATFVAPGPGR
ncbi:MAG: efflux transporter, family, subunit, partial [Chloroflexi bacterium]|nr:efflux transporter, family, subunit [Chloroflexota bacterium]